MDVSFGEDANRTADRKAAENLSLVRRAAPTLVTAGCAATGSAKVRAASESRGSSWRSS
jgi:hypothetical protein